MEKHFIFFLSCLQRMLSDKGLGLSSRGARTSWFASVSVA